MERTNKHNPRVDEELEKRAQSGDVESRREFLRTEAPTEDDLAESPAPATSDGTLDPAAVDARSDLARFLYPSLFPASKDELVRNARDNGAPDVVVGALQELPDGGEFETVQEAWEALGGTAEERF